MKNRRNIIESELPPLNPLDIWMKDGKFYRSTNKGWVLIEDQMEFTNSELMSKSTATSGTIGVNKETGEASIYNDVTKEWNPLGGGGGMTETTWQELKDKRDNGELIPSSLYRITDYNCTTTQENTQSAGHQFDIVLLALSEDKLAEEGWAMMNDNIYDVTFSDGVTKKCYYYPTSEDDFTLVDVETLLGGDAFGFWDATINEQNKTIVFEETQSSLETENLTYNYFQNSNLSAWKVWYCLDNDTTRFAWADDVPQIYDGDYWFSRDSTKDQDGYYGWYNESEDSTCWTKTIKPKSGDPTFEPKGDEWKINGEVLNFKDVGRGVIYRLIDEWRNDVGYDFKNIQFVRPMTDGEYDRDNGEDTWVYTLSTGFEDSSIPQPDGEGGFQTNSKRNYIGQNQDRTLNNIVAITCNDCDFKACSLITLSYCNGLILSACGGDDSVFSFESNAIYINNKKVLTEE